MTYKTYVHCIKVFDINTHTSDDQFFSCFLKKKVILNFNIDYHCILSYFTLFLVTIHLQISTSLGKVCQTLISNYKTLCNFRLFAADDKPENRIHSFNSTSLGLALSKCIKG